MTKEQKPQTIIPPILLASEFCQNMGLDDARNALQIAEDSPSSNPLCRSFCEVRLNVYMGAFRYCAKEVLEDDARLNHAFVGQMVRACIVKKFPDDIQGTDYSLKISLMGTFGHFADQRRDIFLPITLKKTFHSFQNPDSPLRCLSQAGQHLALLQVADKSDEARLFPVCGHQGKFDLYTLGNSNNLHAPVTAHLALKTDY